MQKLIIAIDGPVGSGKSTVARRVAEMLGYIYLDSGAMYRAVAWKALRDGAPLDAEEKLTALARATRIDLVSDEDNKVNTDLFKNIERLRQLRIEHRDLDDVISRLSLDFKVDELQMKRLKKRKLMLKDQIARLESQLIPDLNA